MSDSSKSNTIVMEFSAFLTSGILAISLVYTTLKVQKSAFLFTLIALLLASNLTYIIYIGMYNDRHRVSKDYKANNSPELYNQLKRIVSAAMTFDCVHYMCLNCALWCYCFKYWVASVEV